MYVFGGKGEDNVKFNDFWKFDMQAKKWVQIVVDDELSVPCPRSGHVTLTYGDYIVVFGGIHEITRELNDMYAYDIKANKWLKIFDEKAATTPMILPQSSPTKTGGLTATYTQQSPYSRKATLTGGNNSALKEAKTPARKNNFDTTKKKVKLPKEEKDEEEVKLESPTSVSMKNSLLIKHADPSFD